MEASDWLSPLSVLVAAFGGYWFAAWNDARRDQRTARRERDARAEEARSRRDAERHRIQLDALLALQEDLQVVARHGGRILHFDHMHARRGEYLQTPEEWSESDLAARMRLSRNMSRVLDAEVRTAVQECSRTIASMTLSPTDLQGLSGAALDEAALRKTTVVAEAVEAAMDVVGDALRREIEQWPAGAT